MTKFLTSFHDKQGSLQSSPPAWETTPMCLMFFYLQIKFKTLIYWWIEWTKGNPPANNTVIWDQLPLFNSPQGQTSAYNGIFHGTKSENVLGCLAGTLSWMKLWFCACDFRKSMVNNFKQHPHPYHPHPHRHVQDIPPSPCSTETAVKRPPEWSMRLSWRLRNGSPQSATWWWGKSRRSSTSWWQTSGSVWFISAK